jgi:hypothetical protein
MGTAHVALEPFKPKLSMFKNLNGAYSGSPSHSRGTAEFLTGAPISDPVNPQVDISIDQVIADALDPDTAIRSFHLGPTPYPNGPPADTGWASGYNTYISWSSPTSPNSPLESAQVAFDQVYVPSGTDPAVAEKRLRLRQSILDHTIDQIDTIQPRLGTEDALKLDEYLTAVRDVESTLQSDPPEPGCSGDAMAPGEDLAFEDHTKAMLDIIVLALKCDQTRIVTYSMDYGFGNKNFSFIPGISGGSYNHHNLSHGGTAPERLAAHAAIVRWYMDQIAYFLGRMDAADDGGVTLLDNSVVFIGSDVGEPWAHDHNDLTAMLAGGGAGALDPGRLIDAGSASYDSVLLALAHAMDANVGSFSGASTPFAGL